MGNKIYFGIVTPEEKIKDYKEQINAIIENIDNLDNLILIYSIAFDILLREGAGGHDS